jgi:endogenous inhibitor of DNA gyrase (YacG/DUF329 family)
MRRATAACPTCRQPAVHDGNKLFPFCSERCQLVDLGRWINEDYRIPDESDSSGGGSESIPTTKREDD